MKSTKMLAILIVALSLMVCSAKVSEAQPIDTTFTHQGFLQDPKPGRKPRPADGTYDFQFRLFDDYNDLDPNIGVQVGNTVAVNDVSVIDGYFMVELDFGTDPNVFNGEVRWLETAARPGNSNNPDDFVTLVPRVEVTLSPYAIYAMTAGASYALDAGDGSPMNAVYVDNDGNVGIGMMSPTEKLDVVGNIHASGEIISGSTVRLDGNRNRICADEGRLYLSRTNTDNRPLLVGIMDAYISSQPTVRAKLHVVDDNPDANNVPSILIEKTAGAGMSPRLGLVDTSLGQVDNAPAWFIDNNSDNFRIFRQPNISTAGQQFVLIDNTGNVGIGTMNPSERLHVAGSIRIVDGNEGQGRVLTSDANGVGSWQAPPDSGLPRGVIVMWSGSIENIPDDWALCDGGVHNGVQTPDLRDMFIVGAGNSYSIGDTGGEASHTLTIAEIPPHTHPALTTEKHVGDADAHSYDKYKCQPGGTTGPTGGGQPHENRPPFFALAFIMRL